MTTPGIDLSRAVWQKTSRSGDNGGRCVEVATNLPGVVAVRDSKDLSGPNLVLMRTDWRAFTFGLKAGLEGLLKEARPLVDGASCHSRPL